MKITIDITKEQLQALNKGASIEITQQPIKQWEPKGGDWYIDNDGEVNRCSSEEDSKLFGIERETEKEAMYALTQIRTHNRLLAYVAEFDKDWKADWNDDKQTKYCVYFDNNTKSFEIIYGAEYEAIGTVHMSKECAVELCKKLNLGEVAL